MNFNDRDRFDRLTDTEVWGLFISGNESAFDYIYQKYYDRLYNYGCQFTPDYALVEDTIQELFIELRRRSSYLSSTNQILPYLYSAFRRKIIRMREKTRRTSELTGSEEISFSFSIEDQIIIDESKNEDLGKLKKGMKELSEKHREIIYYFYYECLSYQEIQEILGFDHLKSVRNLLYKAITALRKVMMLFLLLYSFCFKFNKTYQLSENV